MTLNKRSFINLSDIRKEELNKILKRARQLKKLRAKGWVYLYKYIGITENMVYSLGFSSGIILLTSFLVDHSNKD